MGLKTHGCTNLWDKMLQDLSKVYVHSPIDYGISQ